MIPRARLGASVPLARDPGVVGLTVLVLPRTIGPFWERQADHRRALPQSEAQTPHLLGPSSLGSVQPRKEGAMEWHCL